MLDTTRSASPSASGSSEAGATSTRVGGSASPAAAAMRGDGSTPTTRWPSPCSSRESRPSPQPRSTVSRPGAGSSSSSSGRTKLQKKWSCPGARAQRIQSPDASSQALASGSVSSGGYGSRVRRDRAVVHAEMLAPVLAHVLDQREERLPLVRERVLHARGHLRERVPLHDALLLEGAQPQRQRPGADPGQGALELTEARAPFRQIADHQDRPLTGDDLCGRGDGTARVGNLQRHAPPKYSYTN